MRHIPHTSGGIVSRRGFALGTAAALLAPRALAAPPPTGESPLGPFFPQGHKGESDFDLTRLKGRARRAQGEVIEVSGRVLDSKGNPVRGARLTLWQANAFGRYAHPSDPATAPLDPDFQGSARLVADRAGAWRIVTVKPKFYDSPIGLRPPHIHWDVAGPRHRLTAQMYFPEDAEMNARDLLFRQLGAEQATSLAAAEGAGRYRWDIVLMDA